MLCDPTWGKANQNLNSFCLLGYLSLSILDSLSLSVSVSLSLCLSLSFSVSVSICLSVSLSLSLCLFLRLSLSLPLLRALSISRWMANSSLVPGQGQCQKIGPNLIFCQFKRKFNCLYYYIMRPLHEFSYHFSVLAL